MLRTAWQILALVLLLMAAAAARAQSADPPAALVSGSSVVIPRVSAPPKLQDFEGMQPHGAGLQMRRISDFIQQQPTDGAKPSQRTDVYIGYDSSNLYLVWVCFDNKRGLRAHLDRRENIYDDDYVEVLLDTFHDKRHAFVF